MYALLLHAHPASLPPHRTHTPNPNPAGRKKSVEARDALLRSLHAYPCNWSAWQVRVWTSAVSVELECNSARQVGVWTSADSVDLG